MHLRRQTWFPLTIHVAINGREWLARQLDAASLGYRRSDKARHPRRPSNALVCRANAEGENP
jgi:hypothetical protein